MWRVFGLWASRGVSVQNRKKKKSLILCLCFLFIFPGARSNEKTETHRNKSKEKKSDEVDKEEKDKRSMFFSHKQEQKHQEEEDKEERKRSGAERAKHWTKRGKAMSVRKKAAEKELTSEQEVPHHSKEVSEVGEKKKRNMQRSLEEKELQMIARSGPVGGRGLEEEGSASRKSEVSL